MSSESASFSPFEERIDAVGKRHPQMPRELVVRARLLYEVLRLFSENVEQFYSGHGVSASAWTALVMLHSMPKNRANPSLLSTQLAQSRTHMTRIADELVGKGLVRRELDPSDRRRVELVLTAKGKQLIRRVLPATWKHFDTMLGCFDNEEGQVLETLLRKLHAVLSSARQGSTDARGSGR
ncbi:MAG: MarR family transcriptional regulator [Quisquiliibacterium sp.]